MAKNNLGEVSPVSPNNLFILVIPPPPPNRLSIRIDDSALIRGGD